MSRCSLGSFLIAGVSLTQLTGVAPLMAQIQGDNTLGTQVNGSPTITCTAVCTITGGTLSGSNRFHSFAQFSLTAPGSSATFTNDNPAIRTIISRVTGGQPSFVNGSIIADGISPNFDLFLINPSGITFGANADLQLNGSFLASTAQSVLFSDNLIFPATATTTPLLSINVPVGLQLGTSAAPIRIQGNNFSPFLNVSTGKTLALVGGNLQIAGSLLDVINGTIELGSVGPNSLIQIIPTTTGFRLNYDAVPNFQDITLTNSATISGRGSDIQVRGQNIILTDGSKIAANPSLTQAGGVLNVIASESIKLIGTSLAPLNSPSGFFAQTVGNLSGGRIQATARNLIIRDGGQIYSSTASNGQGGAIQIQASDFVEVTSPEKGLVSGIFSQSLGSVFNPSATGQGGDISISSDRLFVRGEAAISASTNTNGRGGNITINSPNRVELIGYLGATSTGLDVQTISPLPGAGAAGNLQITTGQLIVRDEAQATVQSLGAGVAGTLQVTADQVLLDNGASLSATTQATAGGTIQLQSQNAIALSSNSSILSSTVDGQAGAINLQSGSNIHLSGSRVLSEATGQGSAGAINVSSVQLALAQDSRISVNSRGLGSAGNLNIATTQVSLQQGFLTGETQFGSGGNIRLQHLDTLLMSNLSQISASTVDGTGGAITIAANNQILLDKSSQISAMATGNGSAGSMQLTTGRLDVRGGSQASVSSRGTGNAGNLDITAPEVTLQQGTLAAGTQSGTGGNVRLQNLDTLSMTDLSQISASTGDGRGGDVIVTMSDRVSLDQFSQINAEATSNGSAGNIVVTTGTLTVQNNSQLNVKSQGSGSAGNLTVRSRDISMSDGARLFATTASGEGGNINVRADRSIILRRDSDIRTQALGTGNGGNIRLEAGLAILGVLSEDSDVIASAVTGRGGSIFAKAPVIIGFRLFDRVETAESDFIASSEFGIDGSLIISDNNPRQVPPLADNFARSGLAEGCVTNASSVDPNATPAGRFVATQRGGLPLNPTGTLSSQTLWQDDRPVAAGTAEIAPTVAPDSIVEANSWVRSPDGTILLTVSGTGGGESMPQVSLPAAMHCYLLMAQ